MTLLFADRRFTDHRTSAGHPECADRITVLLDHLEQTGLDKRCARGTIAAVDRELLKKHHAEQQRLLIEQACAAGGGYLDGDTPVCPESNEIALLAAGAATAAVDAVLDGKAANALVLARPPGHHATPRRSMGFCLYNNIALAALHAREKRGLDRVLIVDWDVHHGNGTQDFFYADPSITFFSAHRYPFYPGTGKATETGTGAGLGTTFNLPLDAETTASEYLKTFASMLEKAADQCRPQLVLVSAGFDAYHADPIGGLNLEAGHFAELTKLLVGVAETHAKGRLVSLLEGGYHLAALPQCVGEHLRVLLGE